MATTLCNDHPETLAREAKVCLSRYKFAYNKTQVTLNPLLLNGKVYYAGDLDAL